jgi:hypothetical protein|tara:strand:- start:631 stop:1767 length:1137 start_codon:yes stop_codon:yes gene_type:complete
MNKFLKIITTALLALFLSLNFSTISVADNHDKSAEAEIIKELKKEIYSFDAEPPKKKLFQSKKKYIPILKEQLAELKKEEEKNKKVEALKKEIIKEIESLGENPVTENKEVNKDQEIIALKKQLEDIKSSKAAEKKKTDDKKAADKKIADKKAADKKAADENEQSRAEVIQSIKNEILFLGETPLLEFEATNEDEYFDALRKQIDEIKAIKAEEEKDIQQSIPSWFIKLPQGSDTMMYIRGTAVVDTLQGSIDMATNAALRELGKKLDSRLNSKVKETVRQAGIGEDLVTKTEINRVSAYVVKEVTISGWEILETKLVTLDNGKYRSFILVKYPVAQAYQAYISEIENNPKLKNKLSAIKDTEAFKELESFVSEFTGA